MRTVWEYLSVRFDYKGRGITQEFNWTLTGNVRLAGEDGWEMLRHVVKQKPATRTCRPTA